MKKVYVVYYNDSPIHVSDKKKLAHEWAIDHADLNSNSSENYYVESFISPTELKTFTVDEERYIR